MSSSDIFQQASGNCPCFLQTSPYVTRGHLEIIWTIKKCKRETNTREQSLKLGKNFTGHPVQCLIDSYRTEQESTGPTVFAQENGILTHVVQETASADPVIFISYNPYMCFDLGISCIKKVEFVGGRGFGTHCKTQNFGTAVFIPTVMQ